MKKKRIAKLKEQLKRGFTCLLAVYMLLTSLMVFTPTTQTFALTGGPSQPEVQSFEPIGTSDMVDLFSGDMTYNIPLLDVEGYPINLSYSGGPSMDQEASWVGLGWNVNVGTINRALRGLPDDFNGDEVVTETNMKKNWTFGVDIEPTDFEIFGKTVLDADGALASTTNISLGVSLGLNYNSYNGVGVDLGLGFNISKFDKLGVGKSASLGLNSSSSGGLDISPSLSLSTMKEKEEVSQNILGTKIGASFNSQSGLSSLSIGLSKTTSKYDKEKKAYVNPETKEGSANFDLQQPTYTPYISNSMKSFALTARLKPVSLQAIGLNVGVAFGINYSEQELKNNTINSPAYGYLYSEAGQSEKYSMHDFNRENQGSVTPATPNLALTNYTYDIFSVSGQGTGGSYRPFRGQIGHVYSNYASNTSNSIPITVEIGSGNALKLGAEVGITNVKSYSSDWNKYEIPFIQNVNPLSNMGDVNHAYDVFSFNNESISPDYEKVVFREANEMSVDTDPNFYTKFGGDHPVRVQLDKRALFLVDATNKIEGPNTPTTTITKNYPEGRVKRNITIQQLTIKEVKDGLGFQPFIANSHAQTDAPDHHIGQIVSLGTDGMRYVYGQPAYNKTQKEVVFSVGSKVNGTPFDGTVNYNAGLVTYTSSGSKPDNSVKNEWGLDNYYQSTLTPSFAHSYLLTCVVSDDYVDVDGIQGPTDGDLGSYTKFSYTTIDDYKWRVPVGQNVASFNEGLKTNVNDDKANYIYGEKEIHYLDKIETKNFIAVFELENRLDAFGVINENGLLNTGAPLKALKKITLYVKKEYLANPSTAVPLKEVHFVYDYELCPGIPNSNIGQGKLTLKKVFFTYRDSKKGKLNPYVFEYGNNYSYNLKAYDRWGCYKPNPATTGAYNEPNLATFEFPYIDQNDPNNDNYVAAWTLKTIKLPSGGQIDLEFESDDYAYVQHKKAMEMVKIVAVEDEIGAVSIDPYQPKPLSTQTISELGNPNKKVYFELAPNTTVQDYVKGIDTVYFRCLTQFKPNYPIPPDLEPYFPGNQRYDYVSGYAYGIDSYGTQNGLGYIKFKPVAMSDLLPGEIYNPIAVTGIQFARLHLSRYINETIPVENATPGIPFFNALVTTLGNFITGFQNPNKVLLRKEIGTSIVLNKSWLRLNNVSSKKKGGGYRVKSVKMTDNWDLQANGMTPSEYGQQYVYTKTENGKEISSGVASYEPQMGGDENPWKMPIPFSDKKKLAPDDRFYQETPFGESFFPSASVGYSKVEVMNLQYTNVKKNATGKVVHEFYTARDFPTLVSKTGIQVERHRPQPFDLGTIFNKISKDFYAASQGFSIITNDMHGKQKSQAVYPENSNEPLTKVEYFYKQTQGSAASTAKLTNTVDVIFKNGIVEKRDIGVNRDMIADFAKSKTVTKSASIGLNLDASVVGVPLIVFTGWPSLNGSVNSFKSATMTKVVQKFGVLETTRATDLGSTVETKNLAYDAETGQVLITETTTNFKDKVYSMSYPAYWYYDEMGPAYKNIGFKTLQTVTAGNMTELSVNQYFSEGDEVSLNPSTPFTNGLPVKAWVVEKTPTHVKFQLADGSAPPSDLYTIKVLRSGRRNMQSQMMASITTRTNPLHTFKNNLYSNVLQASAIEFTDEWRTYCDCDGSVATASTNPYFLGTRGNFRPKVSYLHLSDRTQSDYNNNTNIRNDGMFVSYTPYYKLEAGKWKVDRKDWTYTAEVTEFNPFGQELENKDALGRYSAATFGFNQTLAKSVAANARYREIGFTSFEDDHFSECADNHFKFDEYGVNRISTDAHAGRNSVRVAPNNSARIKRDIAWCDQTGCETAISMVTQDGFKVITVTGATGQSVLNYEVISGDPTIIPTANGFKVLLSGEFEIQFSTVDDNGCQAAQTLTNATN